MLNQQINLYQERFKEQRIFLSASHMLALGSLLFILMAVASTWYNNIYLDIENKNRLELERKQQLSVQLENLRQQLQELLASNQVENRINKVSRDIAVRKRMIDFVTHNQFGSGQGFSDNLGELSEFKVRDVWLNEISLGEDYMKISGSALQAEKVPEYFNLMRSRKLFKGRVFDIFKLDRTESRDWKVDFVIASSLENNE